MKIYIIFLTDLVHVMESKVHNMKLNLVYRRIGNLVYAYTVFIIRVWGKIRQVYPPKNFLSPISLKVREIIVLVNLF